MADSQSNSTLPAEQSSRKPAPVEAVGSTQKKAKAPSSRKGLAVVMTPPKRQLYISQVRLAEVVILSNVLAQLTNANLPPLVDVDPVTDYKNIKGVLAEQMDGILKDLLAGATIEDGSHIAWFERELQTDVHSVPQLCTKVFVR